MALLTSKGPIEFGNGAVLGASEFCAFGETKKGDKSTWSAIRSGLVWNGGLFYGDNGLFFDKGTGVCGLRVF